MNRKFAKSVELLANISIIAVAVLLSVVLVKHYLQGEAQTRAAAPQPGAALNAQPDIAAGVKLSLPNVNWAGSNRTLLLVLSSGCHFCSESAGFYKRLGEMRASRSDLRMVAVLPQEVGQGEAYLNRLGVKVDEVRQAPLGSVGVAGTPTLALVDSNGVVTDTWVGKLPPDQENDVLNHLQVERASK